MPKLNSDFACRNAKPKAKPQKLTVGDGLHMLVNPDGSKYWRMAYRWHGKQRTLALGVYPRVGLAAAKAARDVARRELGSGIDPSAAKQQRSRELARLRPIRSKRVRGRGWKSAALGSIKNMPRKSCAGWRRISFRRSGIVLSGKLKPRKSFSFYGRSKSAGPSRARAVSGK